MSLRTKLLLLSLLTLILPWAGWQYAQQMETTLRRAQEDALLTRPLLDGFPDEWPQPARAVPGFDNASAGAEGAEPKVRIGVYGRSMHMYIEVATPSVHYEVPTREELPPAAGADRVIVLLHDEFGHERAWSISAIAPGPLLVRICEVGAPWKPSADEVPYVEGRWRETGKGYAIELRAPLNLFGTQLAVQALDAKDAIVAQTRGLAWIHTGSVALKQRLEQYAPDGGRVSVVDTHGWLLAPRGSIAVATSTQYPRPRRDDE